MGTVTTSRLARSRAKPPGRPGGGADECPRHVLNVVTVDGANPNPHRRPRWRLTLSDAQKPFWGYHSLRPVLGSYGAVGGVDQHQAVERRLGETSPRLTPDTPRNTQSSGGEPEIMLVGWPVTRRFSVGGTDGYLDHRLHGGDAAVVEGKFHDVRPRPHALCSGCSRSAPVRLLPT